MGEDAIADTWPRLRTPRGELFVQRTQETLAPKHVGAFVRLQKRTFANGWTAPDYYAWAAHCAPTRQHLLIWKVSLNGARVQLVAAALFQVFPGDAETSQWSDIVNLAVATDYRRLGLGRHLLTTIAAISPRTQIIPRDANLSAQLWLRACGWRCSRIAEACFLDDGVASDGYVFVPDAQGVQVVEVGNGGVALRRESR